MKIQQTNHDLLFIYLDHWEDFLYPFSYHFLASLDHFVGEFTVPSNIRYSSCMNSLDENLYYIIFTFIFPSSSPRWGWRRHPHWIRDLDPFSNLGHPYLCFSCLSSCMSYIPHFLQRNGPLRAWDNPYKLSYNVLEWVWQQNHPRMASSMWFTSLVL
jgi:hypothetical protein